MKFLLTVVSVLVTVASVLALVCIPLHADRVFSTFDPSTAGFTLKFDVNAVTTDDFFSPVIIFSPDGKKAFVNFPGSDQVVVFDPDSTQTIAQLAVGKNPGQMTLSPDGKTIVVVNADLPDKIPVPKLVGSISLIDVDSLGVKTVALNKVDFGLASNVVFTLDGKTGFVSSTGTDEVLRFSVPDGAEVGPRVKLAGGSRPVSLTMSHDGTFLTAVNVADQQFSTTRDSVSIIDVSSFKVRATVTPKDPHDFLASHRVALTLDDSKGIIGDDANKGILGIDAVFVFDTKTGDVIKRKDVGINTTFTTLTPDGTRFVVVGEFGIFFIPVDDLDSVTEIDPPGGSFERATNIVFSSDSNTAYVASPSNSSVYRIDLSTKAVPAMVRVGKDQKSFTDRPFFVTLTPDEKRVAVLNFGSNTIDFIGRTFAFGASRFYANTARFTGLAVANVGAATVNLKLQALSTGGAAFQDNPQTTGTVGIVNPQNVDLNPGQQIVGLASELFQSDPQKNPIDGWVSIDSTDPNLIGFFEIGDASGLKMDGANFLRTPNTSWILPVVRQNDQFSTELMIVNPNFNSTTLNIDLVGPDGAVVTTVNGTLPGLAVLSRKLKSGDGNVADFIPQAGNLDGAYLRITSTLPVGALGFYETADELSVLPATVPPADESGRTTLVAPEVAMLGGFRTVVTLLNLAGGDSDITLTLLGDDGKPLAAPKMVTIVQNNTLVVDLADFFGLSGDTPISGWVNITGPNPGILGAVELFAFDKGFTAYQLTGSSGTDFHFAHVAQGSGFTSGLALVNANIQPAQVTIEVFDGAGALVSSRKATLAPNSRLSDVVSSLLGINSQIGGRIRVRSTLPVVGLELFFTADVLSLAVVPPQTVP